MGIAADAVRTDGQNPLINLAAQAIRRKDWPTAIVAADDLIAALPLDLLAVSRALQAYLQAGEVESAAKAALAARPLWSRSPRLLELAILALGRAGRRDLAAEAARDVAKGDPADLRLAAIAADAFSQVGHPTEAIFVLERAGLRDSDHPRAWYELARAQQRLGMSVQGLASARHALALAPDNLRAIELAARLCLDTGQPKDAADLMADLPEIQQNATVSLLLVEAYSALGKLDLATCHARKLVAQHVASQPMMKRICTVLQQAGQAQLASDLYRQNLEIRRQGLPVRLADGVTKQLLGSPTVLPAQRLDWLWQVLTAHGKAPHDRQAWVQEVTAVSAIDRLILDWMECRPDPGPDLAAMIAGTGPARTLVADSQRHGNGVFIAAAHVGLLFGGLAALALSGLPMTFVSSAPKLGQGSLDSQLISTSEQDHGAIGRALYRAARAGKVVAVAIDGAPTKQGSTYPLFDRQIVLSDFIPRLAWKSGAASFFPSVIWDGDHARLTVMPLPSPAGFPTVETYVQAWMRAFLDLLETQLLNHPGSARANGGFWGNLAL